MWLESVEGLEEAKRRLNGFLHSRPGEYFIYSEQTGGMVEAAVDDTDGPAIRRMHRN